MLQACFERAEACGKYGFFSAHAANSISVTVFIINCVDDSVKKFLKPVLILWVMIFSYSRIYLGVHYPLDTVFGLSFGIFQEFSDLAAACSEAIGHLVLCLYNHTSLNEKIVLAAMAAICHLPSQLLSQNIYQSEHVGEALAISILFLQYSRNIPFDVDFSKPHNKNISSKLLEKNEHFLIYL